MNRATIVFVKDAEEIIAEGVLSAETSSRLQAWIDAVKGGESIDADHVLSKQEIVSRVL
jgi:hypothetical protein